MQAKLGLTKSFGNARFGRSKLGVTGRVVNSRFDRPNLGLTDFGL